MNILFLTMSSELRNIGQSGIYTDLMRKFRTEGHGVYVVYPQERRTNLPTKVILDNFVHLLGVRTLNITKTNILEKGIGQIFLEYQFIRALKRYFWNVDFDLILYSTPPITFSNVIAAVKRHNPWAVSYLLLKDIFPQNAVDLGMLSKTGLKGLLYRFFRKKEERLYALSDFIGCMSPANVRYLLAQNPDVDAARVEIAPNSYEVPQRQVSFISSNEIRIKYGLPIDKPVFICGGNMGKPQGIPFLLKCLKSVKDRTDCHFVVVGDGVDYTLLEQWMQVVNPQAVSLFRHLLKVEYDMLVGACDVGLIFLDYRFTVPNYPSRLLSYMMLRKPIIAVTDSNCDTGTLAEHNGYGYYCPANSVECFVKSVNKMLTSDIRHMGEVGYRFFLNNYTVDHTYSIVMRHLQIN